jgi:hypothetical protein
MMDDIINIFKEQQNVLNPIHISSVKSSKQDIESCNIVKKYFTGNLTSSFSEIVIKNDKKYQSIVVFPVYEREKKKEEIINTKRVLYKWNLWAGAIIDLNNLIIFKKNFDIDKLYCIRIFFAGRECGSINKNNLIDHETYYVCNLIETINSSSFIQWISVYHNGGFVFYFQEDADNVLNMKCKINIIDLPVKYQCTNDIIIRFKPENFGRRLRQIYGGIYESTVHTSTYIDSNENIPESKQIFVEIDNDILYLVAHVTGERLTILENPFYKLQDNEIIILTKSIK